MSADPGPSASGAVEAFIARWQGRTGGQERANYGMFLRELCTALAVEAPDPAGDPETNDYVFERVVKEPARDGAMTSKRIDLYKRDCFVLEAKQSRQIGGDKQVKGQADLFAADPQHQGRRAGPPGWDVLMHNARSQAENYVRLLPKSHEPPPFVIVVDVGHCFEFYANSSIADDASSGTPRRGLSRTRARRRRWRLAARRPSRALSSRPAVPSSSARSPACLSESRSVPSCPPASRRSAPACIRLAAPFAPANRRRPPRRRRIGAPINRASAIGDIRLPIRP